MRLKLFHNHARFVLHLIKLSEKCLETSTPGCFIPYPVHFESIESYSICFETAFLHLRLLKNSDARYIVRVPFRKLPFCAVLAN